MANTQEIKQRIELCARELSEEFGEVADSDALSWLDVVETQAVAIGDAVTAELVKQKSADRPVENKSTCPKCGKLGRYKGQRPRDLEALAEAKVSRERVQRWTKRIGNQRVAQIKEHARGFNAANTSPATRQFSTSRTPCTTSMQRRLQGSRWGTVGVSTASGPSGYGRMQMTS